MSEERKLILDMLKEGKITDDEALRLLDAIGDKSKKEDTEKTYNFDAQEKTFENKANNFVSKLVSGVDTFINRIEESLSGIEFEFDFDSNKIFNKDFNKKITRKFQINEVEGRSNLEVENLFGKIEVSEWDNPYSEVLATIEYNEGEFPEDFEFVTNHSEGNSHSIKAVKAEKDYRIRFSINLAPNHIGNLKLNTLHNKVTVSDIKVDNLHAEALNGKVVLDEVHAQNVYVLSKNGKAQLNDVFAEHLRAESSNGKVEAISLNAKNINLLSQNGKVELDELMADVRNVDITSHAGSIYIDGLDYSLPIKIEVNGRISSTNLADNFSNIQKEGSVTRAFTKSYSDEREDKVTINVKTDLGRVEID